MIEGRAIWLYGSYARGDVEPDSDLDILVIGECGTRKRWARDSGIESTNASVSQYSWREIRGMAAYGSLFLQHLRLEGRPLLEDGGCRGRFRKLLDGLPEYRMGSRDVRGFSTVLRDVAASVGRRWDDPFELSVLATVIRHSAILGCWMHGNPQFGRIRPVRILAEVLGRREEWQGFGELYGYRLYCDRRVNRETLNRVDGNSWWRRGREIVDHLEGMVSANGDEVLA